MISFKNYLNESSRKTVLGMTINGVTMTEKTAGMTWDHDFEIDRIGLQSLQYVPQIINWPFYSRK
jgi:hypothetical protein